MHHLIECHLNQKKLDPYISVTQDNGLSNSPTFNDIAIIRDLQLISLHARKSVLNAK